MCRAKGRGQAPPFRVGRQHAGRGIGKRRAMPDQNGQQARAVMDQPPLHGVSALCLPLQVQQTASAAGNRRPAFDPADPVGRAILAFADGRPRRRSAPNLAERKRGA
jgi:hypothetical protein